MVPPPSPLPSTNYSEYDHNPHRAVPLCVGDASLRRGRRWCWGEGTRATLPGNTPSFHIQITSPLASQRQLYFSSHPIPSHRPSAAIQFWGQLYTGPCPYVPPFCYTNCCSHTRHAHHFIAEPRTKETQTTTAPLLCLCELPVTSPHDCQSFLEIPTQRLALRAQAHSMWSLALALGFCCCLFVAMLKLGCAWHCTSAHVRLSLSAITVCTALVGHLPCLSCTLFTQLHIAVSFQPEDLQGRGCC